MEKLKKIALSILPIMVVAIVCAFNSTDAKAVVGPFKQIDQTASSVTVQWEEPEYVKEYYFGWGETMQEAKASVDKKSDKCKAGFTTHTISGLKAGTKYYIYISYLVDVSNYVKPLVTDGEAYTLPGKTTGLKCESITQQLGQAVISWKEQTGVSGYEYKITDSNKKSVSGYTAAPGDTQIKVEIKDSNFYTIKVRAYNDRTGKRVYGKWSETLNFASQPIITSANGSKKGLTLKWSKVPDAKNYTVYVSRSADSGYKKVTTTTKNTYKLTKLNGKAVDEANHYYIYVIASKTVNGKTVKSNKNTYTHVQGSVVSQYTFE